jgi:hypothetical protein
MLRWLPLLVPFLATGCTYFTGDSHVLVTSTPQGAEIYVDDQPTGETTPALLDLDGMFGDDHRITIRKPGFEEEKRDVFHYTTGYTSRWIDGAGELEIFANPLDWTIGDFLVPFAIKWRYVPHEIHVILYGQGQGPLHEEPAEPAPAQK